MLNKYTSTEEFIQWCCFDNLHVITNTDSPQVMMVWLMITLDILHFIIKMGFVLDDFDQLKANVCVLSTFKVYHTKKSYLVGKVY